MAFVTEIEAKSPDTVAPGEMELPSLEPAPMLHGAPGLLGWLSRPVIAVKLVVATLLLGAFAFLMKPAAFPRRVWREPPPLSPRAAARRPPHLPASPLPDWMQARPSPARSRIRVAPSVVARSPALEGKVGGLAGGSDRSDRSVRSDVGNPQLPAPRTQPPSSSLRILEPGGALWEIGPGGVTLDQRRLPGEWAREARRLFAPPPAPPELPPASSELRLLAPDPTDTGLLSPPLQLRWSAAPGVERYLLTVEALTNPVDKVWQPVHDLFSVEVTGTEYSLPEGIEWRPGVLYRWRVESQDGRLSGAGFFRMLSDRQREQLREARESLGHSQLMRAAIDRAFGFYGAALSEARELQAARPEQPALRRAVRNLEADIHRQRAAAAE
jgi:hypothetical protein